ncbi:MAG: IS66 family transposase [Solirubrobacterales bacterium]|nr:IS66 family transposase [Solirubrobacterales bacterium]
MDRAEAEAIYDAGRDVCVEFILELSARVQRLEERLARLEAQARQDSLTSSRPPSSDPPKTRAQRRAEARARARELMRREGEQRKAGGQAGHQGTGRELHPEDQIDEIVDHYPDACGGCGRRFDDRQRRPDRRFGRHQVAELPPISVIWTEHRTHQLRCRQCRARTSAQLPPQIGASAFGPRLQAAVVTLTAGYRISRRGISELVRDLFGARLSTGASDAICQRASDALAGPHLHLQDWVLDQAAVHVDETGWRTRGEGRALWTAATPGGVFLQIAEHCSREQFNALIGTSYPGIVISDRWNGYSHLDPHRRQACWSHIKRDFRRHADGLGEQKIFGEAGSELTRWVFAAWRAYQHEHHDRERLKADVAPIQTELRALLEEASPKNRRTRWHRQFANNLLKIWPALWTFVTVDGIEPTNNPAERALRTPVIHRKLSLGSQSHNGERFAERALSAAGTCRQQRRSLFAYLSDLITAHNRGDPFPALAA